MCLSSRYIFELLLGLLKFTCGYLLVSQRPPSSGDALVNDQSEPDNWLLLSRLLTEQKLNCMRSKMVFVLQFRGGRLNSSHVTVPVQQSFSSLELSLVISEQVSHLEILISTDPVLYLLELLKCYRWLWHKPGEVPGVSWKQFFRFAACEGNNLSYHVWK